MLARHARHQRRAAAAGADESQFETRVGTAVKELFADAAAGRPVTTESVKATLGQGPAADAAK